MEYDLKYVAVEYEHGWSAWLKRDGRKFLLGSAIKTEKELYDLLGEIKLEEKTPYASMETIDKLKDKIIELEEYKKKYMSLVRYVSEQS